MLIMDHLREKAIRGDSRKKAVDINYVCVPHKKTKPIKQIETIKLNYKKVSY
jgi:hypothetical protein